MEPEYAELRATWREFGKLLDAAGAGIEPPPQAVWTSLASSIRWRPLTAIGALAATVLLAVTLALHLRGWAEPAAPHRSADLAENVPLRPAASSGSRLVSAALSPTPERAKADAADSRDTRLPWHDPLDEQIDRLGLAVVQVRDNSLVLATGPGLIQSKKHR